jgi:hypothetical protein
VELDRYEEISGKGMTVGQRFDEIGIVPDKIAHASDPIKGRKLSLLEADAAGALDYRHSAALRLELQKRMGDDYAEGPLRDVVNALDVMARSSSSGVLIDTSRPGASRQMLQAMASNRLARDGKFVFASSSQRLISRSKGAIRGSTMIEKSQMMGRTPKVLDQLAVAISGDELIVPHYRASTIKYRDMGDTANLLFAYVKADKTAKYQLSFTAEAMKGGVSKAAEDLEKTFNRSVQDVTSQFGVQVAGARTQSEFLEHVMSDGSNYEFLQWMETQSKNPKSGVRINGLDEYQDWAPQMRKIRETLHDELVKPLMKTYGMTEKEAKGLAPELLRMAKSMSSDDHDSAYERQLVRIYMSGKHDGALGKITQGFADSQIDRMQYMPTILGDRLSKRGGIIDNLIDDLMQQHEYNVSPTGKIPNDYLKADIFLDFSRKMEQTPVQPQALLRNVMNSTAKQSVIERVSATRHLGKTELEAMHGYIDALLDGNTDGMDLHGPKLGGETKEVVDWMIGNMKNTEGGKLDYVANLAKRTAFQARRR